MLQAGLALMYSLRYLSFSPVNYDNAVLCPRLLSTLSSSMFYDALL